MNTDTTFAFTQKRVENLAVSELTKTYSDKRFVNLKLTVTSKGTKTYYCRFKFKGQNHNVKIADAKQITLDDARSRAIEIMNLHYAQHNALPPSVVQTTDLTVNNIFDIYKTAELDRRATIAGRQHGLDVAYKKHIRPDFGKTSISALSKKLARCYFLELENKGYSIHNKCLSALKAAFSYVIEYEEELNLQTNPFIGIKKMTEVTRNRYLTHDEAHKLFAALSKVANQDVADIYRVALFTGARLSNVKQMRWSDLNLSARIWLIPSTLTKTRKNYEIPLHDLAIKILSVRSAHKNESDFVFPAQKSSKYGYITGGDNVWKEAIKQAGLYHPNPNIRPRPHDLRRTFATWQIQSGADISIVSKSLCHTSLKHTMIYAHSNVEQVRDAINGAFNFLK